MEECFKSPLEKGDSRGCVFSWLSPFSRGQVYNPLAPFIKGDFEGEFLENECLKISENFVILL